MPVYYKCKICEREHPSPMVYRDEESFDSSILWGEMFQCPEKGKSALYLIIQVFESALAEDFSVFFVFSYLSP
jgi:hypothetical protein